jgi:hypothetical protein
VSRPVRDLFLPGDERPFLDLCEDEGRGRIITSVRVRYRRRKLAVVIRTDGSFRKGGRGEEGERAEAKCKRDSANVTDPIEPVPVVIKKTRIAGSSRNCAMAAVRCAAEHVPSMRANEIPFASSASPTRSSDLIQLVNTILLRRASAFLFLQ